MTFTIIQNSFVSGEISPSLLGRTDLAKWHNGASTMRNFFVNYRGGASSRAGLAYVGTCKQPGTAAPPRDITFQFNINQGYALEFGDQYMRIKSNGAYVTEGPENITGITQASPAVLHIASHGYTAGDWVFITGVVGMTNFNGLTWIVHTTPDANHITLTDLFGNVVNSTLFNAYISGGTASRIYTVVAPYAAVDLPYLKYTQSKDTMTLTCVNQQTFFEYPSYELERFGATNWTFTADSFASSIAAPTGITVTPQNSTTVSTWYSYVVTAVSAATGEESVASTPGTAENNDIAINAGSNTITWNPVTGASSYNVYKATPSYTVGVPIGVLYGYAGSSLTTSFVDNNITADFTDVPPVHNDPFARSTIEEVTPTAGGVSYTQATIGYTITTSTGSGFIGIPIVLGGAFVAFLVQNPGEGYALTDTITITDGGSGAGATATLVIGPATGTYPGTAAYYQQRRSYGYTLNQPDTYFMSQPGAFNNMDSSIPTTDSDAIIGAPWAQQVNGIQAMVPMPNGLVILTGKGAWLLNGGNSAAITPVDQTAIAQAYNGCNDHVPPLTINYDILYVQSKGSIVRDLSYNFFTNIYTGADLTVLSNQLFDNYQVSEWAWAEEPNKIVWVVRNDGTMLSLTYLKEQDIYAWARHDTNGQFVSVCSVTEPPVDAVYVITKRFVQGAWSYYSERMDDREWFNVEDSFCADAALQWPMTFPNATLTISAATGTVTLTASSGVFSAANVGQVVRADGGKMTVTGYNSSTSLTATVTQTLTTTIPDNTDAMPVPAVSGGWSITPTTTVVTGLNHLEGLTVTILADGSVVPNQVVTNGSITLPQAYSAIVVGLPYTCQLQTLYLDPPSQGGTTQTKRKTVSSVGLRLQNSRGLSVGSNQPDASTQPNGATVPWTGMIEIKERNALVNAGNAIPLFTGDHYVNISGDWNTKGQIAIQQTYPLPANVLAVVAYFNEGDTSG